MLGICGGFSANWRKLSPTHAAYTRIYAKPYPTWNSIFTVAEALHGSVHEGSPTYPQNIALASTFNPELAYLRATEISKELHYQGINQILAPCIDVVRDLRWGAYRRKLWRRSLSKWYFCL